MFLPIVLIALTSLIQASNALGLSFPPCDAGEFYAFERAGCRRCSECGDNEYISEKCGVYNDVMCSPCDEPQRDNPDYIDSCIGHPYSPILVKKLSREMKITQNAIRKLTRNERIPLDNIQKLYHEFDAELGQDIADNVEEISKTEEELDKEMEEESVDEAIHLEMKEADQDDSAQVDEDLHEITKKLKKFGESNVRRRSGTFVRGTQYIYRSPIRLIPLEFVNRLEEIPFESEEYDQENDLEEYEAEDASLADEDEALNEKEREVEGLLSQHDDDITGTLLQFGDKSVENPPFTDADFDSNEPMLLSRVPAVRMVGDEYANRFTGRLFDEGVFSDEVDPDSEESDERMDDFNSLERQREPILIKRSDWLKMISDDEHTDGTDSDSDEYIDDYEEGSAFGDRLSIKGIFMICFITSILLVFYLLFVHRLVCSHRYRIDRLPQMDEEQEAFIERCAEGQNIHVYENKLVENI